MTEAIAVRDGRILFTGKDIKVTSLIGAKTRVIEAHGNSVLPGFIDSHIHPISGGILLSQCNLHDLNTPGETQQEILRYAQTHPHKKWIVGWGWISESFLRAARGRNSWTAWRPIAL